MRVQLPYPRAWFLGGGGYVRNLTNFCSVCMYPGQRPLRTATTMQWGRDTVGRRGGRSVALQLGRHDTPN